MGSDEPRSDSISDCISLGIVSQPFKLGVKALLSAPFTTSLSRPVFHLMRTYNRRFAQIARRRRRMSALGKANRGQRCLIKSKAPHLAGATSGSFLQTSLQMGFH